MDVMFIVGCSRPFSRYTDLEARFDLAPNSCDHAIPVVQPLDHFQAFGCQFADADRPPLDRSKSGFRRVHDEDEAAFPILPHGCGWQQIDHTLAGRFEQEADLDGHARPDVAGRFDQSDPYRESHPGAGRGDSHFGDDPRESAARQSIEGDGGVNALGNAADEDTRNTDFDL
jgi:hypothetical protein